MDDVDPAPAPLQITTLDRERLADLFTDVGALANDTLVIVKQGPSHVESQGATSLERAMELLTGGLVHGVQIRYRYQGVEWWDTIMPSAEGFRLVRIQRDGEVKESP